MSIRIYLTLSIMCTLMLFLCVSCDGPGFSLKKPNMAWSNESTSPLYIRADSYYMMDENSAIVILFWKGSRMMTGTDEYLILALDKKESIINFVSGIAVRTVGKKIARLRVLDQRYFSAECPCKKIGTLYYNGFVNGKSSFDKGVGDNWIRFEVTPSENSRKINVLLEQLLPLLQDEKDAQQIMKIITSEIKVIGTESEKQ